MRDRPAGFPRPVSVSGRSECADPSADSRDGDTIIRDGRCDGCRLRPLRHPYPGGPGTMVIFIFSRLENTQFERLTADRIVVSCGRLSKNCGGVS